MTPTLRRKDILMENSGVRLAKDRLYSRKWGVFHHFLDSLQNDPTRPQSYGRSTDWDTLVREFDTQRLAETLHEAGAGYYVITVMQGTKHMIAPNATFDRIAGTKPGEACSTRDLVEDLYRSLSKYDIDLFLYFTGDGPWKDPEAGHRFGFFAPRDVGVTRPFVEKWASVLAEYSERYGDKVRGWWIDGCYKVHFKYTDELLDLLYRACKSGNPSALVSCNNGVGKTLEACLPYEDFLSGEQNDFVLIPEARFYGEAQAHILAPLGAGSEYGSWGQFGAKRDAAYLTDYIRRVNRAGGVVTVDVGVYRDGAMDEEQLKILKEVGRSL
jgi:hypothetical protein